MNDYVFDKMGFNCCPDLCIGFYEYKYSNYKFNLRLINLFGIVCKPYIEKYNINHHHHKYSILNNNGIQINLINYFGILSGLTSNIAPTFHIKLNNYFYSNMNINKIIQIYGRY
jgi:hypothetical protein